MSKRSSIFTFHSHDKVLLTQHIYYAFTVVIALSGTMRGYLSKVFVRVTMTHIHCQRMKVINMQLVHFLY